MCPPTGCLYHPHQRNSVIIDCISDLHGHYPKLEGGDLLIVAGDLTATHTIEEFNEFLKWLRVQDYKEKIFISGNHDTMLAETFAHGRLFGDGICYLMDWGTEFEGLKIWGSPWTKTFPRMNPKCKAFTRDTEEELAEKWALIPHDTDILITHSPPYGILDEVEGHHGMVNEDVGSTSLRERYDFIHPKLHVFGHIHAWGGKQMFLKNPGHGTENNTICVNASHVDDNYNPIYNAVRIEP